MDLTRAGAVAVAALSFAFTVHSRAAERDPFAILKPGVVVSADDRSTLDDRQVLLQILPAKDHELAVMAAGEINVTGAELSNKINDIAALKRSAKVPEIGRLSDPPTLADLSSLTLDDVDLDAIRHCQPGDCGLKLSEQEIDQLRRATDKTTDAQYANVVNREFRQIMLRRVNAYLAKGLSGIPEYATGHDQVALNTAFATLLQHASFVQSNEPQLASYFTRYPGDHTPSGTTSSFLYWSKEKYAWKPIISVTHVTIVDPRRSDGLELVIASREVFSDRYTSGALVLTLLLRGTSPRAPHYLVYLNRTWVDGLHALWRPFVDHRVRSEARSVFAAARARIEGRPPDAKQ
jgi:hypothetical protein